MDNTTIEFEKFLTWFTNLEEIPIYTRRDFLAHVMEIGGIDEKAAKFIDDTLAHLEDNQKRQMAEFDRVNGIVKSFGDKAPEMEERDIANAEAEMQRIADKFTSEYREAERVVDKQEEEAEKGLESGLAEEARAVI